MAVTKPPDGSTDGRSSTWHAQNCSRTKEAILGEWPIIYSRSLHIDERNAFSIGRLLPAASPPSPYPLYHPVR